ncbi:MAG: carbohydrate ABC transporter permease [Caldilinea sp.]
MAVNTQVRDQQHRQRSRRQHWLSLLERAILWIVVAGILFYTLFPFYWAIVSSLKLPSNLFVTPQAYWPNPVTWTNYAAVFTNENFQRALVNSAIVAIMTVLLSQMIGAVAAYALARLPFRGNNLLLYTLLAMTTFPAIAILGSLFEMVRFLRLYNTVWALILTYSTFTLPFTVWVLTNFFKSIPRELEEAAQVDGATPLQTFWRILLPLAAPGMVTTGLLVFIASWNEFLYALTFTIDKNARTVPVAISQFSGASTFELPWGSIMAASVVVTIPLIVLVLIFQRRIIAGLTAGAVKG